MQLSDAPPFCNALNPRCTTTSLSLGVVPDTNDNRSLYRAATQSADVMRPDGSLLGRGLRSHSTVFYAALTG